MALDKAKSHARYDQRSGGPGEAMTFTRQLPSIAEVLGPLLRRVPVAQQPLLIAFAERLAAERYRGWADRIAQSDRKSLLLACAEREEEIARRVETLHPDAATMQREVLIRNPDIVEINRSLFAPYSLTEQFVLQAQGERLGAATWRSFAEHASNPQARDVFLSCAVLEEENATYLESIAIEQAPTEVPALLIIDMQQGMASPSAGPRNNPDAEHNIATLLGAWRKAGAAVVHVRHISRTVGSLFWPGQPGVEFQELLAPLPSEHVVEKNVPDALVNTGLDRWLRSRDIARVVIVGVSTNNSVEATARTAGNLGFDTQVVADATFAFDKIDYSGTRRTAAEVHAMALANLDGEYATIVSTEQVLNALRQNVQGRCEIAGRTFLSP